MAETEAQQRERIFHSERTHDEPPAFFAQAVPVLHAPGEPLDAPPHELLACPSDWIAGRGGPIRSFVVHCTAATNPASATAAFFHSCASDHGSTQYVLDDDTTFLCVPENAICAGAPPLNQEAVHAEMPGLVTWSRAVWLSHMDQIRRMAWRAVKVCQDNDLPVRLFHAADLRREGEQAECITYHWAVSEAFGQSTHNDPGPNFPWDAFMDVAHGFATGGEDMAFEDYRAGMSWAKDHNTPGADGKLPSPPGGKTADWLTGFGEMRDRQQDARAIGNIKQRLDKAGL